MDMADMSNIEFDRALKFSFKENFNADNSENHADLWPLKILP